MGFYKTTSTTSTNRPDFADDDDVENTIIKIQSQKDFHFS